MEIDNPASITQVLWELGVLDRMKSIHAGLFGFL